MPDLSRICVVTDRKLDSDNFWENLKKLIENDFLFIQLREKDLSAKELLIMAQKVLDLKKGKEVSLFINDRADVAHVVCAKGVHLPENGIPAKMIKRSFPSLKIGISVHSLDALVSQSDYDYVIFGNVFETDCKPGVKAKGLSLLNNICSLTDKPVYAIGGISSENAKDVIMAGAYGVAVRGKAFAAKDSIKELLKIREIIGE